MNSEVAIIIILVIAFAIIGESEVALLVATLAFIWQKVKTHSGQSKSIDDTSRLLGADNQNIETLTPEPTDGTNKPNQSDKEKKELNPSDKEKKELNPSDKEKKELNQSDKEKKELKPEELGPYMGAIDMDEYDLVDDMPGAQSDRRTTDLKNPFDLNRYNSYAPTPCDEIAIRSDNLDGSERNALQVRARNSATRQQAGTFDRLSQLRWAFEEEVEEESNRNWWGAHET
jgi:hypothetical protein